MSTLLETVGFLLLVTFAYVVWAPAALLVGGVGLVLAGLALDVDGRRTVEDVS